MPEMARPGAILLLVSAALLPVRPGALERPRRGVGRGGSAAAHGDPALALCPIRRAPRAPRRRAPRELRRGDPGPSSRRAVPGPGRVRLGPRRPGRLAAPAFRPIAPARSVHGRAGRHGRRLGRSGPQRHAALAGHSGRLCDSRERSRARRRRRVRWPSCPCGRRLPSSPPGPWRASPPGCRGATSGPGPRVPLFTTRSSTKPAPSRRRESSRPFSKLSKTASRGARRTCVRPGSRRGSALATTRTRFFATWRPGPAPPSLGACVAEVVASRLAAAGAPRSDSPAVSRRVWLSGDVVPAAPAPLGWRRVSLRTEDERAGLEIALPEAGAHAARLLLFYRGDGGFDSLPALSGCHERRPGRGDRERRGRARRRRRSARGASPREPRAGLSGRARELAGRLDERRRRDRMGDVPARGSSRLGRGAPRRDGRRDAALERNTLPATKASESATGYLWLDRDAIPGHRYRYRVLALTEDGLLGEAFEASVETR